MRIGVALATDFGSVGTGGISRFAELVGRELDPAHQLVHFGVGPRPGGVVFRPGDEYVEVLAVATERLPLNLAYTYRLAGALRRCGRLDLVVVHRPEYALAVPRKVPLVHVLHGGTWNALRTGRVLFGLGYVVAEGYANHRSSVAMSVDPAGMSPATRALATRLSRTRVPADESFRPAAPAELPVTRLVTASRLVPEKRIDRLILLSRKSGLPLVVFGEGPELPRLRSTARAVGADVEFRGALPPAELAADYRSGGIFCMASAFEGYPLAAVEALVAGLPLLAVGTAALAKLGPYGLTTAGTVDEAADVVRRGAWIVPDADRVWRDHSPGAVAAEFWGAALSASGPADLPRSTGGA